MLSFMIIFFIDLCFLLLSNIHIYIQCHNLLQIEDRPSLVLSNLFKNIQVFITLYFVLDTFINSLVLNYNSQSPNPPGSAFVICSVCSKGRSEGQRRMLDLQTQVLEYCSIYIIIIQYNQKVLCLCIALSVILENYYI